jgi:hypothetical protein
LVADDDDDDDEDDSESKTSRYRPVAASYINGERRSKRTSTL